MAHKQHKWNGQQNQRKIAQPAYDRNPLYKNLQAAAVCADIDYRECQKCSQTSNRPHIVLLVNQDRRMTCDQIEQNENQGCHTDQQTVFGAVKNIAHQRISATNCTVELSLPVSLYKEMVIQSPSARPSTGT